MKRGEIRASGITFVHSVFGNLIVGWASVQSYRESKRRYCACWYRGVENLSGEATHSIATLLSIFVSRNCANLQSRCDRVDIENRIDGNSLRKERKTERKNLKIYLLHLKNFNLHLFFFKCNKRFFKFRKYIFLGGIPLILRLFQCTNRYPTRAQES